VILYTALLQSKHCGVNLGLEDFFLRGEKNPGSIYLLFYENFPALVLGKSLEIEKEIWLHKKHPPVYRRISGGGSVMHAEGNLNYSLFLPLEKFPGFMNVGTSYDAILAAVASKLGDRVSRQGYSDLTILCRGAARKFSGNAQCRKRGWIMHHGTLLYAKEAIRQIPYYLRPPPKEPEYRKGRRHSEFMTNVLPTYNKYDLIRRVRTGIAQYFKADLRLLAAGGVGDFISPFQAERKSR
jgi:lipoate-protein ligase A